MLLDREREVLKFAKSAGHSMGITDFSQSAERASSSTISPCVTPSGKLWHHGKRRLLVAQERLALQGLVFYNANLDQYTQDFLSGAQCLTLLQLQ